MTNTAQHHHVQLKIEGGELHRGFVCTAPEDAPCRRRPPNADQRESWTAEEATETGHPCWAVDWVEAVGIEDAILGDPDRVLASVPVTISYEEGVGITPAESAESGPATEQEARDEREALADVLMSDAVRITAAMGRDYALVEADAVLAWMQEHGYRKHPDPEATVGQAVAAERERSALHAEEGYRWGERCDDIAKRIRSGEPAEIAARPTAALEAAGPWVPVGEGE